MKLVTKTVVWAFSLVGILSMGACTVPVSEMQADLAKANAAAAPRKAAATRAFLTQCEKVIAGGATDRDALKAAGLVSAATDPQKIGFTAVLANFTNVFGKPVDLTFTGFIVDRAALAGLQAAGRAGTLDIGCYTADIAPTEAPAFFASKGYRISQTGRGEFLLQKGAARAKLKDETTVYGSNSSTRSVSITKLP